MLAAFAYLFLNSQSSNQSVATKRDAVNHSVWWSKKWPYTQNLCYLNLANNKK